MSQPIVWLSKEQLAKRKSEHSATVNVLDDGSFQFKSEQIITPKGLSKTNKLISVVPREQETTVKLDSVKYLFQELH